MMPDSLAGDLYNANLDFPNKIYSHTAVTVINEDDERRWWK